MDSNSVPLSQEVYQRMFLEMHEKVVRLDERLSDYPDVKKMVETHESIVKIGKWASVPLLGLLHVSFKHLLGKL